MRTLLIPLILLVISQVFAAEPPPIIWKTNCGQILFDVHETSNHQFIATGRKFSTDYIRCVFLFDQYGNLLWEAGFPNVHNANWVEELPDGSFVATGVSREPEADYKWTVPAED